MTTPKTAVRETKFYRTPPQIVLFYSSYLFPDSYKLKMDLETKKREELENEILNLHGKDL